ncbi:AraC family transcriptional regulator [Chondromyces apiculatus]|uniref:Transcriptional regulator, AraC family protein n=1 Tax=Chondromyces apiculatus DSM 436 TaxID=1192034 RepID=A0A017TAL6_9BACT|nr:AraC family transcriptional regulator [Chondromyces apiculatus]EYF05641.1 transcriptional regulator, AraC family protein [Chondromyces apiculatus DSM 436]
MPRRPNLVSRTPEQLDLQDPRGDVLADVLSVSLLPNALYKCIEARSPWGLRVPTRDRAVFYLIVRGHALLEVDGEPPRLLSTGDVAFIPHGMAHTLRDEAARHLFPVHDGPVCVATGPARIGGTGPLTTFLAGFFPYTGGLKPLLLEHAPHAVVLTASGDAPRPWSTATIDLMLAEIASPGPASTLVLQRLADILFVQVLRWLSTHKGCGLVQALSDPPVHHALNLMHTRVDEPWTVAKLASRVGLSRSGFAQRFTQLVGDPPLQYLARWRMSRAAELLRETDDTVAQIAQRVGYESVPSFSKAFKRWQGRSPAHHRAFQG